MTEYLFAHKDDVDATAAIQAKEAAEAAALEAQGYVSSAEAAAQAAEGFRDEAAGYASDAQGYASTAAGHATNAQGYAAAALEAAEDAEDYRDQALMFRNQAEAFAQVIDPDNYYTKTEVDNMIPDLDDYYTKTEIDNMLPDLSNYYTKTEIDNMLLDPDDYYTKTEIDNMLPDFDDYYTKTQVDNLLTNKEDADPDILKADVTDTLEVGFDATAFNAGTKSSGTFTPDPADGNFQVAQNNGAHTLAPPGKTCSIVIQYTNGASAGAINVSGFTMVEGDEDLTTTNGDDFLFFITQIGSFSFLSIRPLQ